MKGGERDGENGSRWDARRRGSKREKGERETEKESGVLKKGR